MIYCNDLYFFAARLTRPTAIRVWGGRVVYRPAATSLFFICSFLKCVSCPTALTFTKAGPTLPDLVLHQYENPLYLLLHPQHPYQKRCFHFPQNLRPFVQLQPHILQHTPIRLTHVKPNRTWQNRCYSLPLFTASSKKKGKYSWTLWKGREQNPVIDLCSQLPPVCWIIVLLWKLSKGQFHGIVYFDQFSYTIKTVFDNYASWGNVKEKISVAYASRISISCLRM